MLRAARMRAWIAVIVVAAVVLVAAAAVATLRLTAASPRAVVSIDTPATLVVDASTAPTIPAPPVGSFAIATSIDGTVAAHDSTIERPIGSVAKAMTALVVLDALPPAAGAGGPSFTMTAADVGLYRKAVAEGGSNIPVRAGEVLSERELLLALLLPSADNIAETLAVRVSGTRIAFIERLNARAAALGMSHTHFEDPSGLSAATVSTASDLVLLARAVTANAALVELVGTRQAMLPDGTVLRNLDILLADQPGWLGIKTGWTGAAGGCLLFAARQSYASGATVTLWGAVLGQPRMIAGDPAHPELGAAMTAAARAATAAFGGYAAVDVGALSPSVTGRVSTPWGGRTSVGLGAHGSDVVLVHAGAVMHLSASTLAPAAPLPPGATVGHVAGTLGATTITWQVVSRSAVVAPSLWWKLFWA
jgi:D-alanyl-D-alanine carboxypeptidase (penicillin-binding protein 5/6)